MKIRITTTIDLDTGDYDMEFANVSHPGDAIDYWVMNDALHRVLTDFERQIEGPEAPMLEGIVRDVH